MVEIKENYTHKTKRLLEEKIHEIKAMVSAECWLANINYNIASQLILADVYKKSFKLCSIACWLDDTIHLNHTKKDDVLPLAEMFEQNGFKVTIYVDEEVL